jgi:hypothetical protein
MESLLSGHERDALIKGQDCPLSTDLFFFIANASDKVTEQAYLRDGTSSASPKYTADL